MHAIPTPIPVDTEGDSWATPLSPCNLQELPHREDRLQLGAGEPACAAFVRGQGAEGRRLVADSQAVDQRLAKSIGKSRCKAKAKYEPTAKGASSKVQPSVAKKPAAKMFKTSPSSCP